MDLDFETATLPVHEQFDGFTECLNTHFSTPLCLERERRLRNEPFEATVVTRRVADATAGHVLINGEGTSYEAKRPGVRHDAEIVCFNFFCKGGGYLEADGRCANIRAGEFAVFSNTRSLDWHFDAGFDELVLELPRAEFLVLCPQLDQLTAIAFRMSDNVRLLTSLVENATVHERTSLGTCMENTLGQTLCNLAAAVMNEQAEHSVPLDVHRHRVALQLRVKSFMREQLRDADLTPQRIADEFGLSLRSLYGLFEEEGTTCMNWLWAARLEQAYRELSVPGSRAYGIGEIAWRNGFKSQAHFAKRFRERYGMTPREVRQGAA